MKLPLRPLYTLIALLASTTGLTAAQPATGILQGRVTHAVTGAYLEGVRIPVEGTSLATTCTLMDCAGRPV